MSISTHSPHAGRTARRGARFHRHTISTHSPHAGRTALSETASVTLSISTHSPHAGRTTNCARAGVVSKHFNSLAPRGANPLKRAWRVPRNSFQLTRPTRGEPRACYARSHSFSISTHSPHAGRTADGVTTYTYTDDFNSLAPRGANLGRTTQFLMLHGFQLTRPTRGEPMRLASRVNEMRNFNSLAPRGANPALTQDLMLEWEISTHSPHAGRTYSVLLSNESSNYFNSLAPRGANRAHFDDAKEEMDFNSLAPRGANRGVKMSLFMRDSDFNSLAPRGANRGKKHIPV